MSTNPTILEAPVNENENGDENEDIELLEQLLLQAEEKEKELTKPTSKKKIESDADLEELEKNILAAKDEYSKAFESTDNNSGFSNALRNSILNKDDKSKSQIHAGDTDSSDDEAAKNFFSQKYNDFGRGVQGVLKKTDEEKRYNQISTFDGAKNTNFPPSNSFLDKRPSSDPSTSTNKQFSSAYVDPVFGLKIIQPLISNSVLSERMSGRIAVTMLKVRDHTECGDLSKDWVIAGAIISKSPVKTTQKGDQFMIWKLSDLKGDIKTISLFLFRSAYKELWKVSQGMVIAVLNPKVFSNNNKGDRTDEASLSIDTAQRVMILGQSKDFGSCKSKKKNGDPCNAIVNLSSCEFCVFHVKQEYNTASRRSELQSSTSGRGLQDLRNKVLGKSEVFYAGSSFTAVRAVKNKRLVEKDTNRMMTLSEYYQSPFQNQNSPRDSKSVAPAVKKKMAATMEVNIKERQKDLERLKLLRETMPPEEVKVKPISNKIVIPKIPELYSDLSKIPEQFKNREFSSSAPKLTKKDFSFDVNIQHKSQLFNKAKALEVLKKKPIEKSNPNFIKHRGSDLGKKRALDDLNKSTESNESKKIKLAAETIEMERKDRIKRIMETKSSHQNLIDAHENEAQDKYFGKLEKKEAMEEKMMNTTKVACKAVCCLKCKYTSFSASDRCKAEGHPLKVIDAEKRFFKCGDCGNRTISLFKIPKLSCKNCQSSKWQRTGMMREKNNLVGVELSIRGDEESVLGGISSKKANINLLVPEEFV